METLAVTSVSGPEGGEGVLEPERREDGWCAVAWADDQKGVLTGLADESVGVG